MLCDILVYLMSMQSRFAFHVIIPVIVSVVLLSTSHAVFRSCDGIALFFFGCSMEGKCKESTRTKEKDSSTSHEQRSCEFRARKDEVSKVMRAGHVFFRSKSY